MDVVEQIAETLDEGGTAPIDLRRRLLLLPDRERREAGARLAACSVRWMKEGRRQAVVEVASLLESIRSKSDGFERADRRMKKLIGR